MYPSVAAAIVPTFKKLEGWVPKMYVDQEDYVTVGMGNLIDPIDSALDLPWIRDSDGGSASQQEIADAWHKVKDSGMAGSGGGNQQGLTDIHLSEDGINTLILRKLAQNEGILRTEFPGYDSIPADAQLGLHSLAWARGPAGFAQAYPHFTAALNSPVPDFTEAARQSAISHPMNASIASRNALNAELFNTAETVFRNNLDFSRLYSQSVSALGPVAQSTATLEQTPTNRGLLKKLLIVGGIVGVLGVAVYAASKADLIELPDELKKLGA